MGGDWAPVTVESTLQGTAVCRHPHQRGNASPFVPRLPRAPCRVSAGRSPAGRIGLTGPERRRMPSQFLASSAAGRRQLQRMKLGSDSYRGRIKTVCYARLDPPGCDPAQLEAAWRGSGRRQGADPDGAAVGRAVWRGRGGFGGRYLELEGCRAHGPRRRRPLPARSPTSSSSPPPESTCFRLPPTAERRVGPRPGPTACRIRRSNHHRSGRGRGRGRWPAAGGEYYSALPGGLALRASHFVDDEAVPPAFR